MGYKYQFTWLYTLETSYSNLVQWEDTAQVYNSDVTDWGERVRTFLLAKLKTKTGRSFALYFGIQYLLVFSRSFSVTLDRLKTYRCTIYLTKIKVKNLQIR